MKTTDGEVSSKMRTTRSSSSGWNSSFFSSALALLSLMKRRGEARRAIELVRLVNLEEEREVEGGFLGEVDEGKGTE